MRVKKVYIAADGTSFETEADCLEYEEEEGFGKYSSDIVGIENGGKEICLNGSLEDFLQRVQAYCIKNSKPVAFLEEEKKKKVYCFYPEFETAPGCYLWVEETNCFIPLDEKILKEQEYCKQLVEMKKRLENM